MTTIKFEKTNCALGLNFIPRDQSKEKTSCCISIQATKESDFDEAIGIIENAKKQFKLLDSIKLVSQS